MAAFLPDTVHDIFVPPSSEWASMELQQFLLLCIAWSRHSVDIWDHTRTIAYLSSAKYKTQKQTHRFQNNWYRNLQSIQQVIAGCLISYFDQILLSYSKSKSILWIYRWGHWMTRWQAAQFRPVGRFPSNRTHTHISGVLMTWTTNSATVWFQPRPGPKTTVRNRF